MTLPHIFGTVAGGAQVPGSWLDDDFNAIAVLSIVPCTATGTNAISLTALPNTPDIVAYNNYQRFSFVAANTTTGAVTAAFGALPARNVYLADGVTQAGAGNIVAGVYYDLAFNSALNAGAGGFMIVGPAIVTPFPAQPVQTITGNTTAVAADRGKEFRGNSAGAITLTLPSGASAGNGYALQILNINTGRLDLTAPGSDRILTKGTQFATISLPSIGDGGMLVCDGGSPAIWSWKGKRSFDSGDQTITAAGALTLAHNLQVIPDSYMLLLHCSTGELGYTAGDFTVFNYGDADQAGVGNRGTSMIPNATNLVVRFGSAAATYAVIRADTGVAGAIVNANWRAVFRAIVLD